MSDGNKNKSSFTWKDLLDSIKGTFEDKEINISEVSGILSQYKSKEEDWMSYTFFADSVYTRNLVDSGNGFYNLIILAWNPGQGTCIHDHANASCFVKVLAGGIREIRYKTPKEFKEFTVVGDYLRERDDVSLMNDTLGIHEMRNDSANQAVTLHLYIPPFESCFKFNRINAKKRRCALTYYSVKGKIVPQETRPQEDNEDFEPCC